MKRIMVNLSLEKTKKKNLVSFEDYQDHIQTPQDDDYDFEEESNYQQLLATVQDLPIQYRQVFNLYVLDEYSHKEISDLLQISVGTSKSNLSRARNLIKQKLNLQKQS